ncbi:MAG: tRNA-dihydrouridine synthase family protein [Bacilli bacterium]|nr:tRNA-dihydrouridine synthase family protein [Bacilli bacterium]
MFKLGDYEINGRVILAPMAGYTFHSYRKFMSKFGASICYSEMVSDMGLIYDNDNTNEYVIFPKEEVPVGVQLFGSEPENLAKAVGICEGLNGKNIDFYDVNMACPVTKVTKTGAGSSLLKEPKRCGDIIRAMKAVTSKPVTAKIRLGLDKNTTNFLEVIKELEEAGVDMIAIHARTAKEMYMGEPHFDLLKDLRSKMNVPLVISGNIFTAQDAVNALSITGADAVMVARGGVGNPMLITNINRLLNGEKEINPSLEEQMEYCKELAREIVEEKGEFIGIRLFRSIGPRFFNGFPYSKALKSRIVSQIVTYDDLERILREYKADEKIL